MEFDQHCCEMHMNSADPYHFKTLHAPLPLPLLEKFVTADHTATQAWLFKELVCRVESS